jgi:carboxymethylenebutenolidase
MCYDDNARPPEPAGANGSAKGEDLVLTAGDGTRFLTYAAQPSNPTGAQIVIFPDVRGLHTFYKELAKRYAETGVAAIAIDYFGRTAGLTARDDSFEYMPHVQQITLPTFFADVRAALEYLRANGGQDRPTFITGFCMGGTLTLVSGTQDFGLAGIIPFYSGLSRTFGGSTPLEQAAHIKYPFLGLYGGADPGIPPEQLEALDQQLDKAGVEHEIVVYPGAPHSFFDRRAADHAEASADAWRRVQGFIATHSTATEKP